MSTEPKLERCAACGHVQYPARSFCARCLSSDVTENTIGNSGQLVSWSILHATLEPSLRDHLPLTVSSIKLDEGPIVIAYFAGQPSEVGQRVSLSLTADPDGATVLVAQGREETSPSKLFTT